MTPELEKKLEILARHAWDGEVDLTRINAWAENFSGLVFDAKIEQDHCLFMLSRFMFFGHRLIKEMLHALYRDQFYGPARRKIRRAKDGTLDSKVIDSEYERQLSDTRFVGLGNSSESGSHLLYTFRQVNRLSKHLFIDLNAAFHEVDAVGRKKYLPRDPAVNHYVIFDDLVGSGQQVSTYLEDELWRIRRDSPSIQISFMCLFASSKGLAKLNGPSLFKGCASCLFELDETYKTFSAVSRYFKDAPAWFSKSDAEEIARRYGETLSSSPLGYRDGQLMLGFHHNTPDNTLPIFWKEGGNVPWSPIFIRYDKK